MPEFNNSSEVNQFQMNDLMKVALGKAPADLAIINGDIVNVYTNEVLPRARVLIKGDRIAYVGQNSKHTITSRTEVIDASGKVLIPGLIDGHTHADSTFSLSEFLKYCMRSGTTTVISELSCIVFPLGYQGIKQFLESARNQPVKVFYTIPPMGTISRASEDNAIRRSELKQLFKHKEVLGLGEIYWAPTIANNLRLGELIIETNFARKRLEGHSSGAKNDKLEAYIAAGITSCHEPITVEEVKERLRLGLFVMIRESDIRNELETIAGVKDENIDLGWVALASDGVAPAQLVQDGYMERIVQKAIDQGFDPITAIKMATINVARYFQLDNLIGGIAPGRYADIVILPDLHMVEPECVISIGRVVA
ncbi:MAG: adenine deaminase [Dehalococcoidia bacterium]|nr:MAG: adenine deaminase [Dehalococcoidia bacterium]